MKRDWTAAREKCEREGRCRYCGGRDPQAAHLWHRGMGGGMEADLIVPLCFYCHQRFDSHDIDILGLLSLDEQLALVRAAGSLERARQRVVPSEYRREWHEDLGLPR